MTDNPNLFGQPGDESFEDSIEDVFERVDTGDPCDFPDGIAIEEWSSIPLREHLDRTTPTKVCDWIVDAACADLYFVPAEEHIERAALDPGAIAAMQVALDTFYDAITGYRICVELVSTHLITFSEDGVPMLGDEPLYRVWNADLSLTERKST